MRAVVVTQPGAPEVMAMADVPDPAIGRGEVLLRVRAHCGKPRHIMQRRGLYPPPPGVSDVLGLEAVGEVVDIAPGTDTTLRIGDRVMCLVGGGAYAELLAVPACNCMPIPDGMSWTDAAAIPEVFITAYQGLVNSAGSARVTWHSCIRSPAGWAPPPRRSAAPSARGASAHRARPGARRPASPTAPSPSWSGVTGSPRRCRR